MESKVSKGLTFLENSLRTISNHVNGGHVLFQDIAFFEHIDTKLGVIYYASETEGVDGKYKLVVFGAKVKEE